YMKNLIVALFVISTVVGSTQTYAEEKHKDCKQVILKLRELLVDQIDKTITSRNNCIKNKNYTIEKAERIGNERELWSTSRRYFDIARAWTSHANYSSSLFNSLDDDARLAFKKYKKLMADNTECF